jgi:ribosome-associated protein
MQKEKVRASEGLDFRQKAGAVIEWLDEKQARDIVALDVRSLNEMTEAVIIASGINQRHVQSLADWILEKLSESSMEFLGMEGYRGGTWILLDCNDLVVHIFQQEYREFYNLEGLWAEAPRIH